MSIDGSIGSYCLPVSTGNIVFSFSIQCECDLINESYRCHSIYVVKSGIPGLQLHMP